jgi:hypothetical protein
MTHRACEHHAARETHLARMTGTALEFRRERFLIDEDVSAILQRTAERKLWDTPE